MLFPFLQQFLQKIESFYDNAIPFITFLIQCPVVFIYRQYGQMPVISFNIVTPF